MIECGVHLLDERALFRVERSSFNSKCRLSSREFTFLFFDVCDFGDSVVASF
jgi:hypothetical protein